MRTSVMIEARGLVKSYRSAQALAGLDLTVPAGTTMCLLGPNGAGKTTAVRVLSTLLRPDAGWARVAGHDVVTEGAAVRRRIGLSGQYASVDECLTGRANLVMIGRLSRLARREAGRRAASLLATLDLERAADRPVRTYSGGMRRRLDLAASLLGQPSVLFLDEPTTGLDPQSRLTLWGIIGELVRADAPLVELMLGIAVLAIASMTAGLLISAVVNSSDKTMPLLVVTVLAEVVLSGGVFRLNGMAGLGQLSWLSPSRWGFAAAASTVNLNQVTPPPPGNTPDPLWRHSPHIWLLDMAMQLVLTAVLAGLTWWRLHQASAGRRR